MATKKKVRIKTASQLEADGWDFVTEDFTGIINLKKGSDLIPNSMFHLLGQEYTGIEGKSDVLEVFIEATRDETLTTWTSLPGLEDYEMVMSDGSAFLTFWDDLSMDVKYKNIYLSVDSANVAGLHTLLNAVIP